MKEGGGMVSIHAANNAFPKWKEYNLMTGLGGWGGRNEKDGPYVYWKDGEIVRDNAPGRGGGAGAASQRAGPVQGERRAQPQPGDQGGEGEQCRFDKDRHLQAGWMDFTKWAWNENWQAVDDWRVSSTSAR